MRRLQLAGHQPLGPRGRLHRPDRRPAPTAERTLNTRETVAEWVVPAGPGRALPQLRGREPARMVNNLDWTAPLTAIDFLREIGKHFRVGTMLKKDAVA